MTPVAGPTAAQTFAAWAGTLTLADVPPPVRHAACRHLVDGIGCALGAQRADAVPFVLATATQLTAPAESTVIGSGRRAARLPAPAAGLANGALVHGLDFDDTHARGLVHATAAVLPAAFAVGEETGASGADILVAAVAGYEVVTRIAAAVPHGFHARGLHATSVCGVFAAALVAAKLYGLGADATTNAIGIAGSTAAGSLEFLNTGSATKQIHPGLAAQAGIAAARLAAAGATGPATILEGERGLYRAYLGQNVDPGTITAALGLSWETEQLTMKPYPNCQLLHAPLDALDAAQPEIHGIDDVASLAFHIPADSIPIVAEPADTKLAPRTPYEAKFSLPWSAAALLIDGSIGVSTYAREQLGRSDVAALARCVSYSERDFDGAAADAPGIVTISLRSGEQVLSEVVGSSGSPARPLDDDAVVAKFVKNGGTAERAKHGFALADLDAGDVTELLREAPA